MIPLFDLHCDTFSEIFKNNYRLYDAPLHISLKKAQGFSPYIQVCAIWSDYHLSNDEAYEHYKKTLSYIKNQNITLCKNYHEFSKLSFILAIEDARILNNQLQRLDALYDNDVRVITLNWNGVTCIGGGWDTDVGLTAFGTSVIKGCAEKGIIVDLSHSSAKTQEETLSLAQELKFSPIFSHSNSYSICKHGRNISDDIFKKIVSQDGLVGISLYPLHLNIHGNANMESIISHIEHFLNLGGTKNICLGCDFDGITSLPYGITSISSLASLYTLIEKKFSEQIAKRLFFYNAYDFFSKNLK